MEVQNNTLVERNEKLQKEVGALRTLAKEAFHEKKKTQAVLEALKHQVAHLLGGQHHTVSEQESKKHPSTGL